MSVPDRDRLPPRPRNAIRRQPSGNPPPLATRLAAPLEEEEAAGFNGVHLLLAVPLALVMLGLLLHDVLVDPEATPASYAAIVQQDSGDTAGQKQSSKKAAGPKLPTPKYSVKVEEHPAEFTRAANSEPKVEATITDESEERPPLKEQLLKVEISGEDSNVVPGQAAGEVGVDNKPRVQWQYGPAGRFGITALDTNKRITFSATGDTNQTVVKVNGQLYEFGGAAGQFVESDVKLPPDPAGKTFGGSKSVWVGGKLAFSQVLELVASQQPVLLAGQQKRLLDTVQVRYIFENKDSKAHTIGLRLQIDTLIGGNDGVPFTVPGLTGLVTTFADFPKRGPIPDFIQALEQPDLRNPGTVAQLSLKLASGIEAPSRVSLTHWPGGGFPLWDVPLVPLMGDSAVVLYWKEQSLKPGEKRTIGFAYGLGSVASTEPGLSQLGLTLGGNFAPGESFTTTAYVQNPTKDQKLTLELPKGLERLDGQETQTVPAPSQGSNNTSIVTWKVKVLDTGTFPLKVVSSNGQTQARTISIARAAAEPESRLTVNLAGAYEPGKQFTVEAKLVSGPEPPALTLKLPAGLQQIGTAAVETMPPADKKEMVTLTRWKVKVVGTGKYAVRVEAANGLAVTKTLSIVRPTAPTGGDMKVALVGPFAPGKAFTLAATVTQPFDGQTLTFALPPGLRFVEGEEKMPVVRTKEPTTVVTWKVMVDKPGSYPLRVQSSNGITLKKTITIEQREEPSGGTFELVHAGDIEPGKEFTLKAKISQPVPGQKLALKLPKQLELVEGSAVRSVPAATKGISWVTWSVRVLDKGTLPIRVESTTGMVRTMTITLTAAPLPASDGGKQIFGGGR